MSPRARRAILLLAGALAAGVGGFLFELRSERAQAPDAAVSTAEPRPGPPVRVSTQPDRSAPAAPPSSASPQTASVVVGAVSTPPSTTGHIEVCGGAPMRMDQVQGLHVGAPQARAMHADIQSIVSALSGGDALAQGASLVLAGVAELPGALPPTALQSRLAELALSSGDADVWTLARHLCANTAAPGPCERLTPQSWSRIDPGNAAPWLWVLAQAHATNQGQAADEALYRASQSRFHDARITGLGRVLAHPALDPRRGLAAHLVAFTLIGIQAAYAFPSYASLLDRCSESQVADANRRLVCDDVAHLLVERSRGAIDVSIGYRLAERLRWDEGRLRAVDDLRLAMQSPALEPAISARPSDLLSCAAIDELRNRAVTQAQAGERAYLAGRLEALGLDTAAAARPVRAQRAAAAASASQSTPP